VTYFVYSEQALMGELDKDGKLQRAYGFNPMAGQQGLWSTEALLHKSAIGQDISNPKWIYAAATVWGVPSAVN